MDQTYAETAFWSRVRKDDPRVCWPWPGYTDPQTGYGKIGYRRKRYRVHRLAFFLTYGYWPEDVCHTCDNITCCNPAHLFPGNAKVNMSDAARKDRIAFGRRVASAVLTTDAVKLIREVCIPGDKEAGYSALARLFGVHHRTIQDAYSGRNWSRV